jgi:DNA-binding NtrC family response regulator
MQAGAVDYLQKPVKPEDFLSAIRRAVKSRMRSIEREYLRDEVQGRLGFSEFVGESKAASEVRSFVEMASQSDASTVISGETGVGKELVARLLHRGGKRNDRPFIVVNCAKPSFEWIHRELYGARDGSSVGKLELAHEGTLFLDEVGELPYEAQGTLLNVLEDGLLDSEGKRPHRVDIRFIASTKLKLKELVAAGNFRVDLFHRLNVLSIDLPTLSERRQDISLLANWLLEKHRQKLGSHCSSISKETLRALEGYFWPGNFRELSNVIERALVMSVGEQLQITDLPSDIVGRLGDDAIATNLKERLLEEEKRLILEALEKNSYIQNQAARALGISRSLMNQKIKRFGIKTSGN